MNSLLFIIHLQGMKRNKATYFSIFFLICFVASFGANSLQGFSIKVSKEKISKSSSANYSTKNHLSNNSNNATFEENENESKAEYHIPAFVLPFFISAVSHVNTQRLSLYFEPFSLTQTTLIYIKVCNFRI